MNQFKARGFINADLERMDIRYIDKPDFPFLKEMAKLGLLNPGKTVMKNTMPIFSAGFIISPYNSVADVWIICDKEAEHCKKEILYYCSEYLEKFSIETGVRRVQAAIRVEHKDCQRLIEALGFEKEGVLKKYSVDGKDCIMYGRIPKCRQRFHL
jgi:hypothetical protein